MWVNSETMIELLAAVAGASITAAAMSLNAASRQNVQTRETIVRLTTAVENLAERLDEFHRDVKATILKLSKTAPIGSSVARLEAQMSHGLLENPRTMLILLSRSSSTSLKAIR